MNAAEPLNYCTLDIRNSISIRISSYFMSRNLALLLLTRFSAFTSLDSTVTNPAGCNLSYFGKGRILILTNLYEYTSQMHGVPIL